MSDTINDDLPSYISYRGKGKEPVRTAATEYEPSQIPYLVNAGPHDQYIDPTVLESLEDLDSCNFVSAESSFPGYGNTTEHREVAPQIWDDTASIESDIGDATTRVNEVGINSPTDHIRHGKIPGYEISKPPFKSRILRYFLASIPKSGSKTFLY